MQTRQQWQPVEQWPYLRSVLHEDYEQASPQMLHRVVTRQFGEADLDQMEDFLQTLAQIGQVALPVIGGVVGSMVAPGAGTAVGPMIGQAAAGALSAAANANAQSQAKPKPKARPKPKAQPRRPAKAATPGPAAVNPAAQLISVVLRPEVLQGIAQTAMGPAGAQSVKVGSADIPVGAILNLIASLAQQAQGEVPMIAGDAGQPQEDDGVPEYMLDEAGEPLGDWTSPDDRARVLLEMFQETALDDGEDDGEGSDDPFVAEMEMAMRHGEWFE